MSQVENQRQERQPRGDRPPRQSRGPRKEEEAPWVPRTDLGKKVAAGLITDMNEIYSQGLRIQEAGIIKKLLPDQIGRAHV